MTLVKRFVYQTIPVHVTQLPNFSKNIVGQFWLDHLSWKKVFLTNSSFWKLAILAHLLHLPPSLCHQWGWGSQTLSHTCTWAHNNDKLISIKGVNRFYGKWSEKTTLLICDFFSRIILSEDIICWPFFGNNPLDLPHTGIDSLTPFEHKWGLRVHHLKFKIST